MAIQWHDVSIPLREGLTVWPGDPAFSLAPLERIADGSPCNTSFVTIATHAGTHIDAPWHFVESGMRLDAIDTSLFFGEALLLDIPGVEIVHAADLGSAPLPPRILIRTRNAAHPVNGPFLYDYVALAEDAAQRIVDEGVKLVGVDYLSVAPFKQPGQGTHHRLLRNNVLVVEGLCLQPFRSGTYSFVVLPLPLAGADGAPCRAFVGSEEGTV